MERPKYVPRRRVGPRVTSVDGRPKPMATSSDGMTTEEVDDAWQRLLEETLPPDKQLSLMKTYSEEPDPQMRYSMLLEFSSYLRQGANREAADNAAASEPPMKGAGSRGRHGGDDDTSLWWEIGRVLLILAVVCMAVMGGAYYVGKKMEGSQRALLEDDDGDIAD